MLSSSVFQGFKTRTRRVVKRRSLWRSTRMFFTIFWACTCKDSKSALSERATLLQTISLPVNYLIMLSLFVLSASNAPTAVVLQDQGPYAQAFVRAMSEAHAFRLFMMPAPEADAQLYQGTLVAVVTIPPTFDKALSHHQPIQIAVQINNVNEDLTNDVQRGLGLAVTTFYAHTFPHQVSIVSQERDAYPQDTDYLPYLALSISVISLMVSGMLQAGMAMAREWETGTIKELLLAPISSWPMLGGKLFGSFLIALPAVIVVLSVIIFLVGDWPANFLMVIGVSLLTLLVFVAAGLALGMGLKDRATLTTITRAISVPLFFVSGVFEVISFQTGAAQAIARAFPVHYAIVLEQYAFKHFMSDTLPIDADALILVGYIIAFVGLASLTMKGRGIAQRSSGGKR